MSGKVFGFVGIMALSLLAHGNERGDLIFADKFESADALSKAWTMTGTANIIKENSTVSIKGGGGLAIKVEIPENYYLSVKISMSEPPDKCKAGFAGIIFQNGTKFLIRPDGCAWINYNIKGDTRMQGGILKIEGFEFGKPNEITVIREKLEDGVRYIYMVNGNLVKNVVAVTPGKNDAPMLWTYRESVTFSDFQINTLK